MGNTAAVADGRKKKKKAKVMKIDGEIFKLKTPIKVFEVIKDHPNHVLLESNTFKRFGIRANPMDIEEYLEGGKIYFLVELPELPEKKSGVSRRVKSEVNLTEKERRELVMMSVSSEMAVVGADSGGTGSGSVRVKVRLPKFEVDKLIGESADEGELAERIVDLCVKKKGGGRGGGGRRRLGTVEMKGG